MNSNLQSALIAVITNSAKRKEFYESSNEVFDLNLEEKKILKSFNQRQLSNFIKLHNSKRGLRFSTIFPKSKNYLGNSQWKKIIEIYIQETPFVGQSPIVDAQQFVDYLNKRNKPTIVKDLVNHELIIYELSCSKKSQLKMISLTHNIFDKDDNREIGPKYFIFMKELNKKGIKISSVSKVVAECVNYYLKNGSWEEALKHTLRAFSLSSINEKDLKAINQLKAFTVKGFN